MLSWSPENINVEQIKLKAKEFENPKILADVIVKNFLDDNYGFAICDFNGCNNMVKFFEKTILFLGEKMPQNLSKDLSVVVEDKGVSMSEGGRYHKSTEGGSLHTDSPQWQHPPDYISLYCINQSEVGGESKLVSALKIWQIIKQTKPDFADSLMCNYYFDKRGEFSENEPKTTMSPIFLNDNGQIKFRFLDKYIYSGHEIEDFPLKKIQLQAIEYLSHLLSNESLIYSYKLKPGEALFCNNHIIAHGRSEYKNGATKRKLIRHWIKK